MRTSMMPNARLSIETRTHQGALYRLLFLGLSALILLYSVVPPRMLPGSPDKLLHAVAFIVLILTFRRGFDRHDLLSILSVTLVLGGLIELLQLFLLTRQASWGDLFVDLVGGILAYLWPAKGLDFAFLLIASVLGIGFLGPGVGTWASLLTLGLYGLTPTSLQQMALLLPVVVLIGGMVGSAFQADETRKDPSWFVLDEVAGMMTAILLVPQTWPGLLMAFGLFRLFDIWKPWPVRVAERLPGGWGIMADDLVAGLLAGIGGWLLFHAFLT